MMFRFGEDRVTFIENIIGLALKEFSVNNWQAYYYIESPSRYNVLAENDKVKLSVDGTFIGINKDWLNATENEYEVCTEVWYNVRKMFQHLQVRRFEKRDPGIVNDYIIKQWAQIIRADGYDDADKDITTITEIDANMFKYYKLRKYFGVAEYCLHEENADDIVIRLAKEYNRCIA